MTHAHNMELKHFVLKFAKNLIRSNSPTPSIICSLKRLPITNALWTLTTIEICLYPRENQKRLFLRNLE